MNPHETTESETIAATEKHEIKATLNPSNVPHQLDQSPEPLLHHRFSELQTVGESCALPLNTSKQKAIYQWQDQNGTTTISDKPRQVFGDTPVKLVGTIQPEMISINYHNSSTPMNLRNTINARVMKAREMFARVVLKHLVKPVRVDFRLFETIALH
ncbi:DUF4124 domain-containing protein [Glaciecola sp. XM2]|uniref:DUF4124 domain-containing protein n=1 Tax=Glaciecola sp. XM2 TaxID=1914931 RepID=UPI001BDF16B2|nr:DUF4124 domain-containing protein [Glaciecola sp. XM2]